MEMELKFKDPAIRRRRLLILLGIAMAIAAGAIAYSLSRGAAAPAAAQVPKRAVLVAAANIPARTIVQADQLTVRQVPDDPSLALAYTEATDVVGKVTAAQIMAGQAIYPTYVVGTSEGAAFSILSPEEVVTEDSPYWRAVSV